MIRLGVLEEAGLRHGFFTREGGVSEGVFATLNCSFGSGDDPAKVAENRRRAMDRLSLPPDRLVVCHQVHGSEVVLVDHVWPHVERPRADAMVTRTAGIALGLLTADCAPILFADAEAGIIGAAHAGWRGAVGGVLAATVDAMRRAGARPERIAAAIGPCIGRDSYEVGPEFPAPFLAQAAENARFFRAAPRPGHFFFDLPSYVAARLRTLGITRIEASDGDTAAEPARFFSYRRKCLSGEAQFGHALSAICLAS
jgi:YfiH family protein